MIPVPVMVPCPETAVVMVYVVGVGDGDGLGDGLVPPPPPVDVVTKVAVTLAVSISATRQVERTPAQFPPHVRKVDPVEGIAVKVTGACVVKTKAQLGEEQVKAPEVTVPDPFTETARVVFRDGVMDVGDDGGMGDDVPDGECVERVVFTCPRVLAEKSPVPLVRATGVRMSAV